MKDNATKPTIVLVHGAFAGSSSWSGVIDLLIADGFPVRAVANPLRGVNADAHYLASTLDNIDGDLMLVGHSYGGAVIGTAAEGDDRVKALVFVGAFAAARGDTLTSLIGRFQGGTLSETVESFDLPQRDKDLYIRQESYQAQFAADVSDEEASRMAVTQRPLSASAFDEPIEGEAWKTIPSWFVFGDHDMSIPVPLLRFMAERAGSRRTLEIPGASHAVMVSNPCAVADIIRDAARSKDEAADQHPAGTGPDPASSAKSIIGVSG
jgi:pimeloyl-ACP methyl ester carboxylesterase